MKTFKDNNGKTWTVSINSYGIKRVRDLLDIDLLEVIEGKIIDKLIADPVLLCDVVYCVCKPQADKDGVTDEEFGMAMAGDAIDNALKAVLEELVGFFPNPRDRAIVKQLIDKTWEWMDKGRDMVEAKMSSGEIDRIVEQALQSVNDSFGDAPAFLESIRDPSPSQN